jgi:AraC family transcriptional regulator
MPRRLEPVHLGSPQFVTREQGPFLLTDAWFPPGLRLPPHEHDRPVVAITLAGGWNSVMRRRSYDCMSASVLIEPAGERHGNQFGSAGGRVVILQPDLNARDSFECAARAFEVPRSSRVAAAPLLAHRLRHELHASDALAPIAVEALCLELLATAGRAASRGDRVPPAWYARTIDYLHAHAREPMTLAQVAHAAGVHPAHLAREFRRHARTSVAAYVRSLRVEWAAGELARSDRPIAEIAAAAGFADQSHLTRIFRRHIGRTPHAFRTARVVRAAR